MTAGKVQMCGTYPETLAQAAHEYALEHGLSLRVVLAAALAEYLAKRQEGEVDPRPQLHYRKGHPPSESIRFQAELMKVDPRGRKFLRKSCLGRAPTST